MDGFSLIQVATYKSKKPFHVSAGPGKFWSVLLKHKHHMTARVYSVLVQFQSGSLTQWVKDG